VTTQASGVISKIYVKDGDTVKSGQVIADIDLDLQGKQRAAQSYASYQSAKNSLQSAKDKYFSLQSSMMTKWKTYMEVAQNSTYENPDKSPNAANRNLPQFYATSDDWLATEADYKNQAGIVSQGETNLNNAWLSYQQTSSTVYAPITGTITGLSLQVGSFITAQSNSSGGSTSQRIANVVTTAPPTITVNLTEIDTPKVSIGNKATVTFDALPGKTFSGNIVSIDTVGAVSSGVTSYPATIKLDVPDTQIYSNMGAQATIITNTKTDTLFVPSTSVTTVDGSSYVKGMGTTGVPEENAVEAGISSDTQTEILSGLSEGDTVITGSTNGTTQTSSTTSTRSIFGGGMGGQIRTR
jgi:multidrug efflux pump subunit AcrA (membrane-fusion protein)